ncbi:MAG: YeeE/YedE thiosulfate transporter family protein [Desulfobulbaceae bacterium]|nr:YeeE/YedE thiosulfate transporter family protein [Desulfobulbaceae bacterium]
MAENLFGAKIKELYNTLCKKEWDPMTTGIIVALLSILMMAWWRPWGAVGAVRNWGDWILYGVGVYSSSGIQETLGFIDDWGDVNITKSFWYNTGSVIGIGFVGGAFLSALLGGQFAFRFPPTREYIKAVIAGILMGIGATFAGGCNVGGMYNALGNLSAHGFAMWLGLIFGVLLGLWLLYKEMEYITWGSGGAKTVDIPVAVQFIIGLVVIAAFIWGAYKYANYDGDTGVSYITSLPGILLIAVGLGYTMQRGRWCMVQGFREPHMTGNCTMAKSVALSICIVAIGAAVLKYAVPVRAEGEAVLNTMHYVRGTFGWGGVFGGFVFGLGAMLAGGCGTGTLWRVGEGQIKLWLAMLVFGISTSLTSLWVQGKDWERNEVLGKYVYLPDAMGYGPALALVLLSMGIWYVVVTWNEESNKLILPM